MSTTASAVSSRLAASRLQSHRPKSDEEDRPSNLAQQIAPANAGRPPRLHSHAIGPAWLRFALGVLARMETASPPARRHTGFYYFLAIIAARVVTMPLVAAALPFAHTTFGVETPSNQQQAVGAWIGLGAVGFVASFVYLFVATVAHFVVLKRTLPTRLWVEVAVFLVFIVTLIYGGISVHYT